MEMFFTTSTPINHIVFFFGRIPVVLENRWSSQGGGVLTPCTLPLDPPLVTTQMWANVDTQYQDVRTFQWNVGLRGL